MSGFWNEELTFDGKEFRADLVDERYASRAGVEAILAIDGLPARFEIDLITAAQICDVPHSWRVKECHDPSEVTPEVISLAKAALESDIKERGSHVITYISRTGADTYDFLAAGSIRNKLTKEFEDNQFPVISRAIVAPHHRGKGLGSLIVEHRMRAVLKEYFGQPVKAIHFGTESKKILHSAEKVEQQHGIKFVHIGDEQYQAPDGIHTVHDYLCFLPLFRDALIGACDKASTIPEATELALSLKENLVRFMNKGVEGISGSLLEANYEQLSECLRARSDVPEQVRNSLLVLGEVFLVRMTIGAADPPNLEAIW